MKIITIVRTLNEERNIDRYCQSHQSIADEIFIADGGSTDNTIKIAKSYPKVKVRKFTERMELENGMWRNPDWKHINFLIEWAENEGADWILFGDCDTTPNNVLQQDARKMLSETNAPFFMVVVLCLFGEGFHFPKLAKPGNRHDYQAGLWGWRASEGIRTTGEDLVPHFVFIRKSKSERILDFDKERTFSAMPPYCRLHRNCPTKELTQKRVDYYIESGLIPDMVDPLKFGGHIEELPDWAID